MIKQWSIKQYKSLLGVLVEKLIGDTRIYQLKFFLRDAWFLNFEIQNHGNGFLNGKIETPKNNLSMWFENLG